MFIVLPGKAFLSPWFFHIGVQGSGNPGFIGGFCGSCIPCRGLPAPGTRPLNENIVSATGLTRVKSSPCRVGLPLLRGIIFLSMVLVMAGHPGRFLWIIRAGSPLYQDQDLIREFTALKEASMPNGIPPGNAEKPATVCSSPAFQIDRYPVCP
jgi:hypothetical protein